MLEESEINKLSTQTENEETARPISVDSASTIDSTSHKHLDMKSKDDYDPLKKHNMCSESTVSNITLMNNPEDDRLRKNQNQINKSRPSRQSTYDKNNFSLEEDEKIIKFFKTEKKLLKLMFDKPIYVIMRKMCAFNRTWEELRSRFLGDIMPNLHKYKCLNIGEVVDMYKNISVELPEEVQSTILNLFKAKGIVINNGTNDISIQNSHNINLIKIGTYIGFTLNEIVHLIVPEKDRNTFLEYLERNHNTMEEHNIHFVGNEEFYVYKNLQKLDENLKETFSNIFEGYLAKTKANILQTNNSSTSDDRNSQLTSEKSTSESVPSTSKSNEHLSVKHSTDNMQTCQTHFNTENTHSFTQYFDCNTSNDFTTHKGTQKVFVSNIRNLTQSEPYNLEK